MNLMEKILNHYIAMWVNYANFSGRTTVPGYWWAYLANFIISFIMGYLGILGTIYSLAVLVPALAMAVRRLNDAGKHWAWIFINFIPLVGQIIFIVMLCQPSKEPNVIDI